MPTRREFVRASAWGVAGVAVASLGKTGFAQPSAADAYVIPLQLYDGRVTMDVMFNGKGPFKVVLDTGGQLSLVDKKFADQLGLPKVGTRHAQRVGGNVKQRDLRQVNELIFGGRLRQDGATFIETDDVRYRAGAVASLAAGFLASHDSELDLGAQRLWIYPAGGPSRDNWHVTENAFVPSTVDGWSPSIMADARLGDSSFRVIVDTGMPRGILLSPKLLAKVAPVKGNWAPARKEGGRLYRAYRADQPLQLGPLTIQHPLVIEDRLSGDLGQSGIIGLEILRHVDLATDVKRNRLFMKKNEVPGSAPIYNMSGLWVDRDGDRIVAGAVGKGSPAEAAGIKVGDRIDGMEFSAMIAALSGPAGSHITLGFGQGTAHRSVDLVLTDYL